MRGIKYSHTKKKKKKKEEIRYNYQKLGNVAVDWWWRLVWC